MFKTKFRSKLTFWLVTALCLNLLLPGLGHPPAEAAPADTFFYDVSQGDDLYPYLRFMYEKGYATGFPDGSFRPEYTLTRAQTAALLVRTAPTQGTAVPSAGFRDVSADHWAKASIDAAVAAGLMKGYPGGSFRPDQLVTRAEAAALALRLTKASAPVPDFSGDIWDVPADNWAKNSIYTAVDAGVYYLQSPNYFAPNQPTTRGEMIRALATMICLAPETREAELVGHVKKVTGSVLFEQARDSGQLRSGDSVTAGMTITTGKDSEVEVVYPDGSGFKMLAGSILTVKDSQGRQSILASGKAEPAVDFLNLDLEVGKAFFALAPAPTLEEDDLAAASPAIASLDDGWHLLADNAKNIWYKMARKKKVKVQVDMPWGVAGARGTFILTQSEPQGPSLVSVLEGDGFASGGGSSQGVPPGTESQFGGQGQAPSPPQPMPPGTQYQWSQNAGWVEGQANLMRENAPVLGNPVPPGEQEGAPPPPPTPPPAEQIIENLNRFTPDAAQGAPPPPAPPEPPPSGGGGHSSARNLIDSTYGKVEVVGGNRGVYRLPTGVTVGAFTAGLDVSPHATSSIVAIGDTAAIGDFEIVSPGAMEILVTAQSGRQARYSINSLTVGDAYQGGLVGYILQSADADFYDPKVQRGLIVSMHDLPTTGSVIGWSNLTSTTASAFGEGIGTGKENTQKIVDAHGSVTGAAILCDSYSFGEYSDWFLPSIIEINKILSNKTVLGMDRLYWSSTEVSATHARKGGSAGSYCKTDEYYVRAVQYFGFTP